jgi:hypothetical protein
MSNISKLHDIVHSWANNIAKNFHTSVRWVDLEAKQDDMRNWQQYRVIADVVDTNYGQPVQKKHDNSYAFQQESSNGGSLPSTLQFSKSQTTTSTFSWMMTEGLSITGTEKFTVEFALPALAKTESETTVSINLNVSSTQQQTDTVTETWTVSEVVSLAPNLVTNVRWVINQIEVDCPFTVDVRVTGAVGVWFNDKIEFRGQSGGKHWLWFIPIAEIAAQAGNPNFTANGAEARFRCHGQFIGVGATNASLYVQTYPLGTPTDQPRALAITSHSEEAPALSFDGPSLIPVLSKQMPSPLPTAVLLVQAAGVS